MRLRLIGLFIFCCSCQYLNGQERNYTTAQAHSHNDYKQAAPFTLAWSHQFGSVETDIFLHQGQLLVAHDRQELEKSMTLDSLYIRPILAAIRENGGSIYKDTSRRLQWMIDVKTEAIITLRALIHSLERFPELIGARNFQIVISGNRPADITSTEWPVWIQFDGELHKSYTAAELSRIAMLSDNFARYSKWNGKGRMPEAELKLIQDRIYKAHAIHKPIRFWNSPDQLNAWYTFVQLGVDYINTDHIEALSKFFRELPATSYSHDRPHTIYSPRFHADAIDKKPKNIILLIGDGTALPQWYAGYTANRAALNVFGIRSTGYSKTSSADHYITDSAPGATAISSGKKTNNRAVGVDSNGAALKLLTEIAQETERVTGIITSGDLRDATPASFYAHNSERSDFDGILADLLKTNVNVMMGGLGGTLPIDKQQMLFRRYTLVHSVEKATALGTKPLMVVDSMALRSILQGRGPWLEFAFEKSIELLQENEEGFLLVLEAAQIDHGGHANNLPYVITELLDFDRLIGKVLQFADKDGETLVIITGDHETGGLTLTGGDYESGKVFGQFSTDDHTAIPVPVFAYGPRSYLFTGVYENTEIFEKIMQAVK